MDDHKRAIFLASNSYLEKAKISWEAWLLQCSATDPEAEEVLAEIDAELERRRNLYSNENYPIQDRAAAYLMKNRHGISEADSELFINPEMFGDFKPLSVREGSRWDKLLWEIDGLRERLALKLAPWLEN